MTDKLTEAIEPRHDELRERIHELLAMPEARKPDRALGWAIIATDVLRDCLAALSEPAATQSYTSAAPPSGVRDFIHRALDDIANDNIGEAENTLHLALAYITAAPQPTADDVVRAVRESIGAKPDSVGLTKAVGEAAERAIRAAFARSRHLEKETR